MDQNIEDRRREIDFGNWVDNLCDSAREFIGKVGLFLMAGTIFLGVVLGILGVLGKALFGA